MLKVIGSVLILAYIMAGIKIVSMGFDAKEAPTAIGMAVIGVLVVLSGIYFIVRLFNSKKNHMEANMSLKMVRPEMDIRKKKVNKELTLKEHLSYRIVGQEEAIKQITKVISKNVKKQEIDGSPRPLLGVFLLVGLTGVGKTETAKALAQWFGYKYGHQFLQFDMGNFSDYHTASTLTGAPKGYIGSEEGGALTRPLMENPKAVILFDEIEKAHPSLYKPLMRLLDEGKIQEVSTGEYAYVYQGIILFTSNLWQATIRELYEKVKDPIEREMLIRNVLSGKIDDNVMKYVSQQAVMEDESRFTGDKRFETRHFPPEFLGRIDAVIPYKPLQDVDLAELVFRMMINFKIAKPEDYQKQEVFDYVWKLVYKYEPVAKKYGVRVFLKKVEEELLG